MLDTCDLCSSWEGCIAKPSLLYIQSSEFHLIPVAHILPPPVSRTNILTSSIDKYIQNLQYSAVFKEKYVWLSRLWNKSVDICILLINFEMIVNFIPTPELCPQKRPTLPLPQHFGGTLIPFCLLLIGYGRSLHHNGNSGKDRAVTVIKYGSLWYTLC